jgi:hypothetical protein
VWQVLLPPEIKIVTLVLFCMLGCCIVAIVSQMRVSFVIIMPEMVLPGSNAFAFV